MDTSTCACCSLYGPGQWYMSDHGRFYFFICWGDCQDEMDRIDLMISICFDWLKVVEA